MLNVPVSGGRRQPEGCSPKRVVGSAADPRQLLDYCRKIPFPPPSLQAPSYGRVHRRRNHCFASSNTSVARWHSHLSTPLE
jgi:hypothetical protein